MWRKADTISISTNLSQFECRALSLITFLAAGPLWERVPRAFTQTSQQKWSYATATCVLSSHSDYTTFNSSINRFSQTSGG